MEYTGCISTKSKSTVNEEFELLVENINRNIDAIRSELKKDNTYFSYVSEKLRNITYISNSFEGFASRFIVNKKN